MSELAGRYQRVQDEVAAAARRAGRDPGSVTLVAVSKGFGVAPMRDLIALGQRDFGENRVQEAAAKYKELRTQVRWHFVGRLQRNKVRFLAGWVDLVHSIDRAELATEFDRRAARTVEVLIEVNLSGDPARGGIAPADVPRLAEALAPLPHVRVTGLMGMAPPLGSPGEARPYFRRLAQLSDQLAASTDSGVFHHLSMGMSQDYGVAVEEGATIVRIGEALFGPRPARTGGDRTLNLGSTWLGGR
ncbi:MAG TPA: YggS family pyridoxal phosphate-dependent enzyme [Actinomycetota bacterium]|nr:YggS family pyridoxal phosphate-dependent enzyme [Actinomycetota bacterium]